MVKQRLKVFLFILMLTPYSYGSKEKWTLKINDQEHDVAFEYRENNTLAAVYINDTLIEGADLPFANLFALANVVISAHIANNDIMPLGFAHNLILPDQEGGEVSLFEKGRGVTATKFQNLPEEDSFVFQLTDRKENKIWICTKGKNVFRMVANKEHKYFHFKKDDDFDRSGSGSGSGSSLQANNAYRLEMVLHPFIPLKERGSKFHQSYQKMFHYPSALKWIIVSFLSSLSTEKCCY